MQVNTGEDIPPTSILWSAGILCFLAMFSPEKENHASSAKNDPRCKSRCAVEHYVRVERQSSHLNVGSHEMVMSKALELWSNDDVDGCRLWYDSMRVAEVRLACAEASSRIARDFILLRQKRYRECRIEPCCGHLHLPCEASPHRIPPDATPDKHPSP